MTSTLTALRTLFASLRMLVLFTVILGVGYPLAVTAIAQVPVLKAQADGSLIDDHGSTVGSRLVGQNYADASGNPLPQYFQPRPSAAGSTGYDPTASSAGNLGPESITDTLPDPAVKDDTGRQSLLTQVCARSLAIGKADGVDGARPFCTADGVGAVLAVFWSGPGYAGSVTRVVSVNQTGSEPPFLARYRGVPVTVAAFGQDYSGAQLVPVRGSAPASPAVPSDAVTASGSGLDPDISPGYARIQQRRIAAVRGVSPALVQALVSRYSSGRELGFLGEPRVNVLELNLALDRDFGSRVKGR